MKQQIVILAVLIGFAAIAAGAERYRVRAVGRIHTVTTASRVKVTVEFPEGSAQQSSAALVQALRDVIALEESIDRAAPKTP